MSAPSSLWRSRTAGILVAAASMVGAMLLITTPFVGADEDGAPVTATPGGAIGSVLVRWPGIPDANLLQRSDPDASEPPLNAETGWDTHSKTDISDNPDNAMQMGDLIPGAHYYFRVCRFVENVSDDDDSSGDPEYALDCTAVSSEATRRAHIPVTFPHEPSRTDGGFTVVATEPTWPDAQDAGSVFYRVVDTSMRSRGSISRTVRDDGRAEITVSGLAPGEEVTLQARAYHPEYEQVDWDEDGYPEQVSGQALFAGIKPKFEELKRTENSFQVAVTNFDEYLSEDVYPAGPTGYADTYYKEATFEVTAAVAGGPTIGPLPCKSAGSATSGAVTVSCDNGSITVTGLTKGQQADLTVAVTDPNHTLATATFAGNALYDGLKPELDKATLTRTEKGFEVDIADFGHYLGASHAAYANVAPNVPYTSDYYAPTTITAALVGSPATARVRCDGVVGKGSTGSAECTNKRIAVTGLANGQEATIQLTVEDPNHLPVTSDTLTGQALFDEDIPQFGPVTRIEGGFTVTILNFDRFNLDDTIYGDATNGRDPIYYGDTTVTASVAPAGGKPGSVVIQCDGTTNKGTTASATCTNGTILVTGLPDASSAKVTVEVKSRNQPASSARIEGQALKPALPITFDDVTQGKGTFSVKITDFDKEATYAATTSAGKAAIADGVVTVTELKPGQSATVSVAVTKKDHVDAASTVTGAAWKDPIPVQLGNILPREGGFAVPVTNYDKNATYEVVVEGGGSATIDGSRATVSGLGFGVATTLTVTALREGFEPSNAIARYRMPADAGDLIDPTGWSEIPEIDELEPGVGAVTRNDTPVRSRIKSGKKGVVVTWNGMEMRAAHVVDDKVKKAVDGAVVANFNGLIKVNAKGFAPESRVQVWVFSTPTLLGTFTANAKGGGEITVQLPPQVSAGEHTLVLRGVTDNGDVVTMSTGITVKAAPGLEDPSQDGDQSTEVIPPNRDDSTGATGSGGSSNGNRVVGAQKDKDGALANTGTRTVPELRLALILILLGVGFVVASTRRRPIYDAPASAPAPRPTGGTVPPPVGAIRLRPTSAPLINPDRAGRSAAPPTTRRRFRRRPPAAPPRTPVTGLDNLGPGTPLPDVSTAAPTLKGWVDAVSGGRTALSSAHRPGRSDQQTERSTPSAQLPPAPAHRLPMSTDLQRIADLLAEPDR